MPGDKLLCCRDIVLKYSWRSAVADKMPFFHAARSLATRRNPVPLHGHDFAEIFWIDGGRAIHRINGRNVPLAAGDLVMMRPTDYHAFDPLIDQELQMTNIAFPAETYHFLRKRYFPGIAWAFWSREQTPFSLHLEPVQRERFNRWADILAQSPQRRIHIERFLIDVLTDLTSKDEDTIPRDIPDWLSHACHEIHKPENFSKGVSFFLKLANRSREHVARSCKESLGMSPTEYVNEIRMVYAARQLEMSNRSILEIALDCGIENLSHFYKLFRKRHGMPPRLYKIGHRVISMTPESAKRQG